MSVRAKLLLLVSFAVVVSVAILATVMLGIHRRAFDDNARQLVKTTVEHHAERLDTKLEGMLGNLELLAGSTVSWPKLTPEQRQGALWLVYRQSEDVVVASLFDERRRGVGPSAYVEAPGGDDDGSRHPTASLKLLEIHVQQVPYEGALRDGKAIGEPYVVPGRKEPFLPLAVRVAGPAQQPWVVAVGLSLRSFCAELGREQASGSTNLLVHGQQILCPRERAGETVSPWLRDRLVEADAVVANQHHPTRGDVVLAQARTSTGWTVVAEQSASQVYASSARMVEQSIFWAIVSLVVACVAGLLFSRSITRPIRQLVAGTQRLARGEYDVKIDIERGDELGRLADAFERMSEAIAERDASIREHNETLQERVEARTRDLREAHAELLQSQKLAALTTLAGGMAHEVNNPLAVIVMSTETLIERARASSEAATQVPLLQDALEAAGRIRDIVARLGSTAGRRRTFETKPFALFALLQDTAALFESELGGRTLEVSGDDAADLPPFVGSPTLLQHALLQLLSNAVTATDPDGHIAVTCRRGEADRVEVAVEDDGRGIPEENVDQIFDPFFTTKDEWRAIGLGLTVVHRIIEEHCGKIRVSSRVGEGTTVTLDLPLGEHGLGAAGT